MSVVMANPGLHYLIQCMGKSFRLLASFISPIGDNGQTRDTFSAIMCFIAIYFIIESKEYS